MDRDILKKRLLEILLYIRELHKITERIDYKINDEDIRLKYERCPKRKI